MRKAGATPKLTMSTRLSSSAPNRVPVFERRATRPSSASRMPAKKMYHPARSNSPRDASTIDHTPKNRLKSVNRLGTTITTRRMLGRGKRRMFMGSPRSPAVLRQQGGARPDAVAHSHPHGRACRRREGHVHARPEPDHPQPLALLRAISRFPVRDDATRDQPSDLAHQHRPPSRAHADRGLLVVETRLVGRRVQELAAVVADQLDGARRGIAVHVHVEHVHEDGDPGRRGREIQDRKSTRLNSSHLVISYAVFCLKKKKKTKKIIIIY